MIFDNQRRIFIDFINNLPNDRPLAKYFPEYFKQNKQMGSRDRKNLSRFVYQYFRIGNVLQNLEVSERLNVSLYLCNTTEQAFLTYFNKTLADTITLNLDDKFLFLKEQCPEFNHQDIFPFHTHLSEGIDAKAFISAQLVQPDLFLRAVRGKEKMLEAHLQSLRIPYVREGSCFRLANATPLQSDLYLYEVQDRSSQQVSNYFQACAGEYWWDCCAGSGGKSLSLLDKEPDLKLLVSDMRESILKNLDIRFDRAGIRKYTRRIIDLTGEIESLQKASFDGIILDAPCSGSGTWARTPEMIPRFNESMITYFSKLQKDIADNAIQFLKPGKALIYITCSVFKEENEDVIDYLVSEKGMVLESVELIKGYTAKADTMFVARLIRK